VSHDAAAIRVGEDSMILVTGSVTAREESLDEVRQLSLEHVQRSRDEPGCISHAVHIDCENPLRLVFVEQWTDKAALLAHFAVAASRPGAAAAGRHRDDAGDLRSGSGGEIVVHGAIAILRSYCDATSGLLYRFEPSDYRLACEQRVDAHPMRGPDEPGLEHQIRTAPGQA
jgi:quinol monooxygenase YgiN